MIVSFPFPRHFFRLRWQYHCCYMLNVKQDKAAFVKSAIVNDIVLRAKIKISLINVQQLLPPISIKFFITISWKKLEWHMLCSFKQKYQHCVTAFSREILIVNLLDFSKPFSLFSLHCLQPVGNSIFVLMKLICKIYVMFV